MVSDRRGPANQEVEMSRYALKKGVTYDTDQDQSEDQIVITFDMVKDVSHRLAENFGCFYLYAFDNAGRPLKIMHSDSEMERMALERLIESDFTANDDYDLLDEDAVEGEGGDPFDADDDSPDEGSDE
jgi:hypothetical protein